MAGSNLVLIEPEIAEVFPNDAAVNEALRTFIRVARAKPLKRHPRRVRRGGRKSRVAQP